tara:strand:- start:107 stop:1168 length:1062 start_codon:yes stop_codon:yes gene_type:complete
MSILYKGNIGGEMKEEELTLLARLVKCAMPIDRTNHLNKFHKNFAPIPTDFSDAQSWEYCCYTRAEELWNIGKPITLFWSGGIDSTAAFLSLRDTMSIGDKLHIRYTQESIDEFPNLYEDIKVFSSPILTNKEFFDTKALEPDHVFVTGECGDQVFGSDVLEKHEHELNEPWETVVEWPNLWAAPLKKQPDQSDRLKLFAVLEKHIPRCPIEVKNVFDLLWWINFSIKWEYVNRRIFVRFFDNANLHKNYSFFNTQDFQKWSLANHSIKHKNTWMTYKQPAKDFIKRITGDKEYQRSKLKEASLLKLVDDDLRETRFKWNDDKIFLLLDDGRFWKYKDRNNIPNEVIEELRIV